MSAPQERKLVHICGFPSSGTDLLSNFMSCHPDIEVRGEFPLLAKLANRFGPTVPSSQVGAVVEALRAKDVYRNFACPFPDLASFRSDQGNVSFADIYVAMLARRNAMWCGNKTPQNTEHIRDLLKLFPETRFIFIVRDIRDVCVSWRRKWGKNAWLCAAKWNARMTKGLRVMETLPDDRVLELRFERLLSDPIGVGRAISDFLDVPYHDNFRNYHHYVAARPDGKKNFGKPINPTNLGKWRFALAPDEAQRIEEIAFPMMVRFGYTPEFADRHRAVTPGEFAAGMAHDVRSAFFVGNQYRRQNGLRDRLRNVGVSIRYRMPYT